MRLDRDDGHSHSGGGALLAAEWRVLGLSRVLPGAWAEIGFWQVGWAGPVVVVLMGRITEPNTLSWEILFWRPFTDEIMAQSELADFEFDIASVFFYD
jgi:hypothetical protein